MKLLLFALLLIPAFGQTDYTVVTVTGAMAEAQSPPGAATIYTPISGKVVITCPSVILPTGAFIAGSVNTYTASPGSTVTAKFYPTDWSISPHTPCDIRTFMPNAFPGNFYIAIIPASMAGQTVSWSDILLGGSSRQQWYTY